MKLQVERLKFIRHAKYIQFFSSFFFCSPIILATAIFSVRPSSSFEQKHHSPHLV